MPKKNLRGFTLIEILISLVIIGIIISMSTFALKGIKSSSRDAKRKADLEDVRSALEIYRTDCGAYPASLTPGQPLVGSGTCAGNTYMSTVPQDPLNSLGYMYAYRSYSPYTTYFICAYLENVRTTQVNCRVYCGPSLTDCSYRVDSP